jgi:hypothetical protein
MGLMPAAKRYIERAAGHPITLIDLNVGASATDIDTLLDSYGPAGRTRYIRVATTADVVYPIAYTLFFGLLSSWLLRRYAPRYKRLNLLILGTFCFDLLENTCIAILNSTFPHHSSAIAEVCTVSTYIKFGFLALVVLLIIGLSVKGLCSFLTVEGGR